MTNQIFDITIIGGGIVGLTLACALKNSGLKIAIIDEHGFAPQWKKENYHHRVSAINLASQKIFENIDVWDQIEAIRVSPYKEMIVWDATGVGEIHFDCASVNKPNLGHIIENNVMHAALNNSIRQNQTITCIEKVKPVSLIQEAEQVIAVLSNGNKLTTKFLVGADGAHSWVRAHTGTKVNTHSYEQLALVTTVRTEKSHNKTAWQRFMPTGPLAFLPLADPYLSSIVWSAALPEAERLKKLTPSEFNQALTAAFDNRLGQVECIQPLHTFPLYRQHVKNYVHDRIALIGDAAHVIHPLAGQGLNLGLLDAACLAQVIMQAPINLRRYERWCKGHNATMMTAMSGFKHLFMAQNPWLMMLRNLGLRQVNHTPQLKQLFVKHALGLSSDLPELAQSTLV